MMKRREFIQWVGVGGLATSLPVAIAACTPKSPEESAEAPAEDPAARPAAAEIDDSLREDGFAALGTVADLDAAGFLAKKSFIAGPVVVIRDPANPTSLRAINSFCTHQGCTVDWDGEANLLACPCHGSRFNPDGSVAEGPATEALGSYEVKLEGELVLVKAT